VKDNALRRLVKPSAVSVKPLPKDVFLEHRAAAGIA
jgi:hypothetical protein